MTLSSHEAADERRRGLSAERRVSCGSSGEIVYMNKTADMATAMQPTTDTASPSAKPTKT